MEIRRVTQVEDVDAAGYLFDAAPEQQATERFLADDRHHLLIAYVGSGSACVSRHSSAQCSAVRSLGNARAGIR